ncbi:hypothetical protein EMPS_01363 [Entomortierella parvispora]|uniref:Uncharacterized protein n=1 Tax=Entomortierella parvispora TaxID=205924 RepID=A0A9P3H3G1_9FUNG|nr:hypothetical protein EMPS_01363 [Entomortierella parvispora]
MAVALQPKKKLKSRSRQRNSSSRLFEEDEDTAIVSRLEREPWQPDLLLERQSDSNKSSSLLDSNTRRSPSMPTLLAGGSFEELVASNETTTTTTTVGNGGGFQGVIPVIIKSPASVITTADSDCVDSIFEDMAPKKISGIQEYLQQTHAEQEQQRQHQKELQLQYQLPSHIQKKQEHQQQQQQQNQQEQPHPQQQELELELEQQRQPRQQKRQQDYQRHLQYRNSFHGESTPFLHLEETEQQNLREHHGFENEQHMAGSSFMPPRPLSTHEPRMTMMAMMLESDGSPLSKTASDNEVTRSCLREALSNHDKVSKRERKREREREREREGGRDVIDSLLSLKNIAMLALDNLLQQVVSAVTASDPVYNPDETTLKARAIFRESSLSLSSPALSNGPMQQSKDDSLQKSETTTSIQSPVLVGAPLTKSSSVVQKSISQTPIAGMATSSLERLDELARKVDQLTVVVSDDSQPHLSQQYSNVLHEPLDIPTRRQDVSYSSPADTVSSTRSLTSTAAATRIEPALIFESQEYQLACTLAALLACIYRILNRMQEPRIPLRTESADSGLDQASRLWKRLSSNSFGRITSSHSIKHHLPSSSSANNLVDHSTPTEKKKQAAASVHSGTNGWMQSINRQVRTLRSRRTQSTSHIEVPTRSLDSGKRPSRLFGIGSSSNVGLHPVDAAQSKKARELEQDWGELDKLMEEMTQLWRSAEGLQEQEEEVNNLESRKQIKTIREGIEEDELNPFHDSHQQSVVESSLSDYRAAERDTFDQQTLDMAVVDDLPEYDDAPQYRTLEKQEFSEGLNEKTQDQGDLRTQSLTRETSRGTLSGGLEDEKTRFDLSNVMSAIERLCRVTPRLDNQRVQLSPSQKRQMAQADVAGTIEKLSKGRWENQRAYSASAASTSRRVQQEQDRQLKQHEDREMTRDLNKLVNQIVESSKTDISSQRAEMSPRQQWKMEGARIGDRIERGEKMRLSDQDWNSPEKVLLMDMTRLTNALYLQSSSTQAFATQRFTLTEDKERNMALQGIISKIERLSDRRLENQDALPASKAKHPYPSPPFQPLESDQDQMPRRCNKKLDEENLKAQELQQMLDQVVGSGGGAMRKSALASQRAEFSSGPKV